MKQKKRLPRQYRDTHWQRRKAEKTQRRLYRKKPKKARRNSTADHCRVATLDYDRSFSLLYRPTQERSNSTRNDISKTIKAVNKAQKQRQKIDVTNATSIDIAAVVYAVSLLGKGGIRAKKGSKNHSYLQAILSKKKQDNNIYPIQKYPMPADDQNAGAPLFEHLKAMPSALSDNQDSEQFERFSVALVEAYNNVLEHAQSKSITFGSYQDTHIGGFVLHDPGVGIKSTIRKKIKEKGLWGKFNRLAGNLNTDQRCLKAVVNGKTSTEFAYRGKGLQDIIDSVNKSAAQDAILVIASGRGVLSYSKGKQSTCATKEPLRGTLLFWVKDSV